MLSVLNLYYHKSFDHFSVGGEIIDSCHAFKILGSQQGISYGLAIYCPRPLYRICPKIYGIVCLRRILIVALLVDFLILFIKGLNLFVRIGLCKGCCENKAVYRISA